MRIPFMFGAVGHPTADALMSFTDARAGADQAKVAEHLAECARCRASVQRLRLARAVMADDVLPSAPASLRERMLNSRSAGTRVILPVNDASPVRQRKWIPFAAAAALMVVAVLAEGIFSPGQEVGAGATSGTLTITPAMPRSREALTFAYEAPASLAQSPTLVLRARLRTGVHEAYQGGVPVRAIARLTRGADGMYRATATLPDSVVFAAIVVEDTAGATIDDHEKRTWEVLTSVDGKRPAFAALYQRTNDMMGRSFEEGRLTAQRMVDLYPDSLAGWSYLHSFENWSGVGSAETTLVKHRATLAREHRKWRSAATVPANVLGRLTWYSRSIDTATYNYWRPRLMSEARTDGFALQWRLMDGMSALYQQHDTTAAFVLLDSLWNERAPDRAVQIAGTALDVAIATGRPSLIASWRARVHRVSSDTIATEVNFADKLSRTRALQPEGTARLRALLTMLRSPVADARRLTETKLRHEERTEQLRRVVLAALGRALVASGATKAGLDTLSLAARTGWDLAILRTIRNASFSAGDSATGWVMTARIVADPSVSSAQRDSLSSLGVRTLGPAQWAALERDGAVQFSQRMLSSAKTQSLAGSPRLRDATGTTRTLKELAANRVTVVAFWSRSCGWALDDLESLNATAKRLAKVGSQMLVIIDDEPGPSPDLTAFLSSKSVTTPVYFDIDHSASKAFNNWGTPDYYVLDADGRIRFTVVTTAVEALVRAEAVRLAQ